MAITNEIQCAITYARSPRHPEKCCPWDSGTAVLLSVPPSPRRENGGVLSRYLGIFAFYLSSLVHHLSSPAHSGGDTRSPASLPAVLCRRCRPRAEAELREQSCDRMVPSYAGLAKRAIRQPNRSCSETVT